MKTTNKKAFLVVDMQNDFCPEGALAVPEGDKIIPVINDISRIFSGNGAPVFASRDWHPPNHISFKERGGPWPAHCVQSTKGAELHPKLKLPKNRVLIYKGMEPEKDSYSAFGGKDRFGVTLLGNLDAENIGKIYIAGLALDYCVKATALDAKKHGFEVVVFENATKAVNVNPEDGKKAVEEMRKTGIVVENFYSFDW